MRTALRIMLFGGLILPGLPALAQGDDAAVLEKLAAPVEFDGFAPETTLAEALDFLEKHYGVNVRCTEAALRGSKIRLPKMVNVPLARVFEQLASEAGGAESAAYYRVHAGAVEVTSARGEAALRGRIDCRAPEAPGVGLMSEKLALPVTIDGFEPHTPLREALGFLSERYGLSILVDSAAFRRLGLREVEQAPVQLGRLFNVPLGLILHRLLAQVRPAGLAGLRLRATDVTVAPAPDARHRVAFAQVGKHLATASPAGPGLVLQLWDRATGRCLVRVSEPGACLLGLAFIPDGRELSALTLRLGKTPTHRWSRYAFPSGQVVSQQDWPARGPAALSVDGRNLTRTTAAGLGSPPDGTGLLGWDHDGDTATADLWTSARKPEWLRLRLDEHHGGRAFPRSAVTLSENGELLATTDWLGQMDVWEVDSGRRVRAWESAAPATIPALSADGRLAAACLDLGREDAVAVWDMDTGQRLCRLSGAAEAGVRALAFARDGRTLAGCTEDGTPILWDLADLARPGQSVEPLLPDQLEDCWIRLAGLNGERALEAVSKLAARPGQTVPFLRDKLSRPAEPLDALLARNLRDLDADQFIRREAAEARLRELGSTAEPPLREELGRPGVSLEMRRRLERLLGSLQYSLNPPEVLRELRAIRALERCGTPEAVRLLERLSQGEPEAVRTEAARAAWQRTIRTKPR